MSHEPYVLAPISMQFSSLLASNDIAQVTIPGSDTYTVVAASASCRALTSGTATAVILNGAGTNIFSINLTGVAPMCVNNTSPNVTTVTGGDKLRFGMSGLGIGLADVCVTIWLKMPSVS